MQSTNWKALAGGLMLAATVALPGTLLAADHHDKGHHGHEMLERMAEKLDLTEAQKAQLKAKREAQRDDWESLKKQKRELRDEIRTALDSGADQTKLDRLAGQLGAVELKMMQQKHQMHQDLEAILTDEQKAKLEQWHSERKERHMQRPKSRSGGQ